jgi:hypothetical protein
VGHNRFSNSALCHQPVHPITLLEAKADIDFMFDANDILNKWVYPEKDPKIQMERQADAALQAGRMVIWHAQTEKGERALRLIAEELDYENLKVVHDQN